MVAKNRVLGFDITECEHLELQTWEINPIPAPFRRKESLDYFMVFRCKECSQEVSIPGQTRIG